jgi:tol-pal system beta propeller repeat protein TolB
MEGKIGFISRGGEGNYEICVMQANGNNPTRLASFPFEAAICFVSWSPNGQKIAFTSHLSGNYEVYVMNTDGSDLKQLTFIGATTYGSAWSPDGKHIAFTSTQSGTEEVYVMSADGSNTKRLSWTSYFEKSQPKAYNKNPVWSPDGQYIAFASARSGEQEIFLMNADGSDPKQITDSEGMKDFPSWSPNGKHIAFVQGSIFVVDTSGANLRQLTTNTTFFDTHPTWSANSQYLAYGSRVEANLKVRPPRIGHTEIFVTHVATTKSMRLTTTNTDNDYPFWIH